MSEKLIPGEVVQCFIQMAELQQQMEAMGYRTYVAFDFPENTDGIVSKCTGGDEFLAKVVGIEMGNLEGRGWSLQGAAEA